MSRRVIMLVFVVVLAAVVTAAPPPVKYTDRFDNVDVDQILKNGRILTNYIKCLLDQGSCTGEGRELKRLLPDALNSDCSKCNERQKAAAEKVINFLMNKRPQDWVKLEAKYDPSGAYRKRFEALRTAQKI